MVVVGAGEVVEEVVVVPEVGGNNAVRVERGRGTGGEGAGRTPTRDRLAGAGGAVAAAGAGGGGGAAADKIDWTTSRQFPCSRLR